MLPEEVGRNRADILRFLYSFSGACRCRTAAYGGSRCRPCRRLPGLDCGVLLFDGLSLPPAGDGVCRCLRVFRHTFPVKGFDIGFIRFGFQLRRLFIIPHFVAVPDRIRSLRRRFRSAFRFIHCLDAHVVVFIFSNFLMGFGRCRDCRAFHDDFLFHGCRTFDLFGDFFLPEAQLCSFRFRRCLLCAKLRAARQTGFRLICLIHGFLCPVRCLPDIRVAKVCIRKPQFCCLFLHSRLLNHASFVIGLSIHFVVMMR